LAAALLERYEVLVPDVLVEEGDRVSKIARGLVAGYGAKKLGGCGCVGLIIFILLWWLLGATGLEIFQ
jgi:hypothetical protein